MKKYIVSLIVMFFLICGVAYGAMNLEEKALKYFDRTCSKNRISNHRAALCYLYERGGEQDEKINEIEQKLEELEQKINEMSGTYCGDGIIQQPNNAGTGGLNNDGYEECDTYDIIYQGWGYHCSPDCTIGRCSLGQGRPCHTSEGTGIQWCTEEGLWGDCQITD